MQSHPLHRMRWGQYQAHACICIWTYAIYAPLGKPYVFPPNLLHLHTFSEGASKSIGPKRRVESSCQRMKISFLVSCLSNHHFPASFVILGSPYTTNDLSRYNCNLTLRTAVPFTAATQFSARYYFQPMKLIDQALRPGCAGSTNCTLCVRMHTQLHARRRT